MGDKKIFKNPDNEKPYLPLPHPKPPGLILKENLHAEIYSLLKFIYLFLQQHIINPSYVAISVGHT